MCSPPAAFAAYAIPSQAALLASCAGITCVRMADIRILFNLSQYLQSGLINTVILPMLGANLRENAVGKRYFAAPSARPIIALNDSERMY